MCAMLHSEAIIITKLLTTPVHNRRAICIKKHSPAQRQAESQHYRLNTSERILSLELWSLTQGYLDLTFSYVALPARWCTTQSKKATDAYPWGLAASSNILLTSNCLIIFKYIFYMITWIITKLSTLSKLPVLAVAYPVFPRESLNLYRKRWVPSVGNRSLPGIEGVANNWPKGIDP